MKLLRNDLYCIKRYVNKCDFTSCFSPAGNSLTSILPLLHPECHSLPEPNLLPGQLSHGAVGMQGGRVHWISMAFESVSSIVRTKVSLSHMKYFYGAFFTLCVSVTAPKIASLLDFLHKVVKHFY